MSYLVLPCLLHLWCKHCAEFLYYFCKLKKSLIDITDITGRKRAIKHYIDEISSAVGSIDDVNTLDRILSLLMQATSSVKVLSSEDNTMEFEIKDHFAPTQKNETQLQFKKTCADPGRKSKQHIMRYACYD